MILKLQSSSMPQKPLPDYTWDPVKRRYRDKQGHLVRNAVILALILRAVRRSKKTFEQAAQELLDQKITERQFQAIMQQGISAGHLAMAAIAAGGAARLVGALLQQTRHIIATQTAYMLRLGSQIALGQVSEAQLMARTGMYADALYSTFANIQLARETLLAQQAGATSEAVRAAARIAAQAGAPLPAPGIVGPQRFARRIIDPGAEHCEECPALAARGWIPVEQMVPIGDTTCLMNCRCTIEYSDGATSQPTPTPAPVPPAEPRGGAKPQGPSGEGTQIYISLE
jgi:hypothetical protein